MRTGLTSGTVASVKGPQGRSDRPFYGGLLAAHFPDPFPSCASREAETSGNGPGILVELLPHNTEKEKA